MQNIIICKGGYMDKNYLGSDIKNLGFGLMRLPMKDDVIDIEQTKNMVDAFMAKGFNYSIQRMFISVAHPR